MKPTKDSLVLYKQTPALVSAAGVKLDILLPGGKTRSVREKDIFPLHPGPVPRFPELEKGAPEGQPEEAWELLQGESPSLQELAELVYGEYSPSTSWLAFKLLNRSPWFRGTPDAIEVADIETVTARIKSDQEKANAEQRWEDFLGRFQQGNIDREADEPYLRDLEMYALGRSKGSRILKAIGKTQSPENAHRVMIAKGVKDPEWNPHPIRLDVPLDIPDYSLGEMSDDEERLNLTGIEAFAIDDEGNQDPDDAVTWDGTRFWVHVADVSGLIPVGSDADEAARERAGSLYLPELTVPMLPPEAAAKLGLGLHETSPALSYSFEIDDGGELKDFSIHLTRVRVTRLTYREADKRMGEEPFAGMKKITDAFRSRRKAAGAVSINLPEVKIRVDGEGEIHITSLPELASRKMVTEAMLMAGSQAALWCLDKDIPVPFAVQERSDDAVDGAVDDAADEPGKDDYVAQFNRRKGMKRSRTTLECSPHAGLGLKAYTRITSPLRRYPDLIASRQIRSFILGRKPEDKESVLAGLAAFESRTGSLVQSERRSNLFWKLQWLKRRPDWSGEAVLVDRRERQGFFLIPEIAMETRVALKKDVKPGGRVILKLKEADIAESTVLFIIQEVLD